MSLLSRLAVRAARAYGMLAGGVSTNVSADYLVVAGGGGGGNGGGGGAGGLLTSTSTLSTLNTYSIVVGAGGAGSPQQANGSGTKGTSGNNSSLSGTGLTTITSTGGGYGAGGDTNNTGGSGGSGGGGAGLSSVAGTGTSGQGNNGGNGGTEQVGGGGGGSGGTGGNGVTTFTGTGGAGGNGTSSSISGSSVTYASGGGGAGGQGGGTGGTAPSGGGGNGGTGGSGGSAGGSSGTANTGGGGGGGATNGQTSPYQRWKGGDGGSGIVIISYTSATPKFVGGTITTSGGKQIHTFTSSGTLAPVTEVTASYLVVAGGGGGGASSSTPGSTGGAGGGGGGGLLSGSTTLYYPATYTVTVGGGGNGSTSQSATGTSGSNSIISGTGLTTITSTGGGGGGSVTTGAGRNGLTGGSGGGGGATAGVNGTGGAGTSGQGSAGGNGLTDGATYDNGGGGGGASAVGSNATSAAGGNGGAGSSSSISGSSVTYAGGGGGSAYPSKTQGTGGSGGGGNSNSSGTVNLGGGGGGGIGSGSAGGSGVVIISYAGSQVFNGGTVTTSGGNTIHTFYATGALTPITNNLTNSLRFRASASAYLSRTPTKTGNRQTFTYSFWMKRGTLGTLQRFIGVSDNATGDFIFAWTTSNTLEIYDNGPAGTSLITTQVFRDPSAWYHIVIVYDTTNATTANRVRLYVNGNQVTAFGTAVYPAQNTNSFNNQAGILSDIGIWPSGSQYFDGYIADFNFIDGQALEPYYFGSNDSNNVWKPIKYYGTYGTNGFYLTFSNTTSTTTLGYDSSPNGNNWTTNNISLTAGTTYDAMTDVPTNTSATQANYAVLNPLWKSSIMTLAGANLNVTSSGSSGSVRSTIAMASGKFYCEATINTGSDATIIGISNDSFNPTSSSITSSNAVGYYGNNGDKFVNGTQSAYGASYTTGNIIGIALDVDAGTITFYKNNVSQGSITHGLTGPFYFTTSDASSGSNIDQSWNFGQRPFSYTPPTGFVALNTYNLPTPTIIQGNRYMDATLYTGNTVGLNIVNASQFKPDLVWIKDRSQVASHVLTDSVRGVTKQLFSNLTNAQQTDSNYVTSFNTNGFTVGTGQSGTGVVNNNGDNFVGWQWQAGQGTTSSNTNGSITSTVCVSTTAGFSVATFTGTGANATVGHGLGVAPKLVIVRATNDSGRNWAVWHTSIANTQYLILNSTAAVATDTTFWNSTSPTSSVISVGSNVDTNRSGNINVIYSWAEITGFSKFGSYTGNSSADGPFVYLGFRPKYVMIKNSGGGATSSLQGWIMIDTSRSPYNLTADALFANNSNASNSGTSYGIDMLSNGFKTRGTDGSINESSATYIYMAFAENPLKYCNSR